jgi:selenium metabolism protein YedF
MIKSDQFGEGQPDLGAKLIESSLGTLLESDHLPRRILFLNSGIFLTTEGSHVSEILQGFVAKGTAVLSCGTCLKYYDREDKLVVGQPTDMKATVTTLQSVRVITI